ncbi:hypothetical protein HOD29_02545 [archaeon]|jgi:hypothetical protein|nr:hypothetical protein [archaeon]
MKTRFLGFLFLIAYLLFGAYLFNHFPEEILNWTKVTISEINSDLFKGEELFNILLEQFGLLIFITIPWFQLKHHEELIMNGGKMIEVYESWIKLAIGFTLASVIVWIIIGFILLCIDFTFVTFLFAGYWTFIILGCFFGILSIFILLFILGAIFFSD